MGSLSTSFQETANGEVHVLNGVHIEIPRAVTMPAMPVDSTVWSTATPAILEAQVLSSKGSCLHNQNISTIRANLLAYTSFLKFNHGVDAKELIIFVNGHFVVLLQ